MSKTTKALAILGVVAGLGVAALPFNALAAVSVNGDNENPVNDEVIVKTTIKDYISIELSGVDGEKNGEGDDAVEKFTSTEPTDGSHPVHTLDLGTLVNNAENPLEGSLLVNVKTNNVKGYKLGIKANGENLANEDGTNLIPTGIPAAGTSAWGFKVAVTGTDNGLTIADAYSDGNYKAVPYTENTNIANSSKATDLDGTETKVTFGVTASAIQAADTYQQTVVFTAATEATTTSD